MRGSSQGVPKAVRAWALGGVIAGALAPGWAITVGQVSDFQDGSTQGWSSGPASPLPPLNVGSGGPAGAGDAFLQASASGVHGPGGKLVLIAGADWSGDYVAAGVDRLEMDLANFGSTALSLRLYLAGPPGFTAVSLEPLLLPAGSGWVHASFELRPAALSGAGAEVLAGVTQLRLFHGTQAGFPGEDVVATLGVDKVSAVPELPAAPLLAAGLALWLWRRRAA